MSISLPAFRSAALEDVPTPDYVDMFAVSLPQSATRDPEVWAETLFSQRSIPRWVQVLLGLRQLVVPLIGLRPAPDNVFAVRSVAGDEALISADDRHLDFRCGIGVDAELGLVRVTTVVRLKGWRGRLYFAPVRVIHPFVVTSMLRRAARHLQ